MAVKGTAQVDITDITDAYSVILTSEAHTFPGTTSAAKAGSTTTQIIAMLGGDTVAASVDLTAVVAPTGVTVTKDSDATSPTLTIAVSTAVTAAGTVDIPVTIGTDITIHKTFSFAIAFTGTSGKGVSSAAVTYQASTSGTVTPTGTWATTIPTVAAGSYLWTRTITTYTDSSTSTQYSVGKMGSTGSDGADALVVSITSSNGFNFKNTSVVTTLTAHVYKGGVELTSSTSPTLASVGTLKWYKDGSTTAAGTGQTLSITAGTVTSHASYVCQLEGSEMAVKASAQCTLTVTVDVSAVVRYYLLQASTATKPSKPTVKTPSGWTTTEPTYTTGSTNSLYTCDRTDLTDGTWSWSDVSLSSSYEAAKAAYNLANTAKTTADATAQHFFADTSGAHVTTTAGSATSGPNMLLTSAKMALRDGTAERMAVDSDSIDFYDADGTTALLDIVAKTGYSYITSGGALRIAPGGTYESGGQSVFLAPPNLASGVTADVGIGVTYDSETGKWNPYVLSQDNGGVLNDWVASETTSGIWRVRTWASGLVEMLGKLTTDVCCNTAAGSACYYGALVNLTLPFSLTTYTHISCGYTCNGVFTVQTRALSGTTLPLLAFSWWNWGSSRDAITYYPYVCGYQYK